MKISVIGILVALIMATAFGQGQREQLVSCMEREGDLRMQNRALEQDIQRLRTDLEAANRRGGGPGQAANSAEIERDRARMDADRQRARADSLERRVNELAPVAAQAEVQAENLKTMVAENARLVAENAGLRQGAAAPATIAVPTFVYPICGTITAIQVINHQGVQVIQTDFSLTNMGSRTISAFDGKAKFYSQGNLIFETPLQNVRQAGGAPIARNGNFPFRIGIPITVQSQQLPSLRPEMIDLVIEVTRVQ
jgi:regulator of replication initiation timing